MADVQDMSSREGAGSAWLPLSVESASMAAAEQPAANDQVEGAGAAALAPMTLPVDLPTLLRELEDAYIRAALARTQCNKKEAAKLLGMGRTTLVEKLRRRNMAATRSSS